jgi:hypothetical protein
MKGEAVVSPFLLIIMTMMHKLDMLFSQKLFDNQEGDNNEKNHSKMYITSFLNNFYC